MKHLSCALLLISLLGMTVGCSQQSGVDSEPEYDRYVEDLARQTADYDRQMAETDKQLKRSGDQVDRFDKLLDKWEQQADRQDKIFDAMERFLDKHSPDNGVSPSPDDAE